MTETPNTSQGVLTLVVGPSGAGKDTLITGARKRLAKNDCFAFPKRHITRPADSGGEDHIAVSEQAFRANDEAGRYALSWRAHGLCYGVPESACELLCTGQSVVVNVSRSVLEAARARFKRLKVLSIVAPSDVLRARLVNRGREEMGDIEGRVARAAAQVIVGEDVVEIVNNADIETGIERFMAGLQQSLNEKKRSITKASCRVL